MRGDDDVVSIGEDGQLAVDERSAFGSDGVAAG